MCVFILLIKPGERFNLFHQRLNSFVFSEKTVFIIDNILRLRAKYFWKDMSLRYLKAFAD